jgi:SpoVK/Ycf46/Vps4 family AAA+-type ATPase
LLRGKLLWLFNNRSNAETAESGHGSLHNRILSTFLNELDGISASSPDIVDLHQKRTSIESTVFVLAACKDLSQLDEALIRPG